MLAACGRRVRKGDIKSKGFHALKAGRGFGIRTSATRKRLSCAHILQTVWAALVWTLVCGGLRLASGCARRYGYTNNQRVRNMADFADREDDALLRETVAEQLAQKGHVVTIADGGIAAQRLLEQHRFDAMVLDLGLPVVDGITVLKWARLRFGAMPIMILTA